MALAPRLVLIGGGLAQFIAIQPCAAMMPKAEVRTGAGPCVVHQTSKAIKIPGIANPLVMTMDSDFCYQSTEGFFDRPTDSLRDLLYGRPVSRAYYSDTLATKMVSTKSIMRVKASALKLEPADDIIETETYRIDDDLPAPPLPAGTDNGDSLIYPMVYDTPAPPPMAALPFDPDGPIFPMEGMAADFGPAILKTPEQGSEVEP